MFGLLKPGIASFCNGLANFFEGEIERNDAGSVIRLTSGDRLACGTAGASAGVVCGVLRPEDIRVANGDSRGMLAGTIREVAFFGESVRYRVALDSGFQLIALVPGSRSKFAEGARVSLDWDAAKVWLLPKEDRATAQVI